MTRVLVYTRTTAYRHASIPTGIGAIRELGAAHGFAVDATEDPAEFAPHGYDAVVFLSTSGEILDSAGKAALESYVRGGGGFVGIHGAAATEYEWPFYERLVGAWFDKHPQVQQATVRVVDRDHPATAHLEPAWVRVDEWYNFRANPRSRVRVLATVDESTYTGGTMGADHPIAWCHNMDAGRVFYTAGGHTDESFVDGAFRQHLLGGILSVTGGARSAGATG
jgi:type 1 glutamine amidotransferase